MKNWSERWIKYKTEQDLLPRDTNQPRVHQRNSFRGRQESWRQARLIAQEGERLGGLAQFEAAYQGFLNNKSNLVKEITRRAKLRRETHEE
jgi:hypothetical protein